MANDKNASAASAATPARRKRAKKEPSLARKTAMAAVESAVKEQDAAKSDQEKTVADSKVKAAREALKALKFTEIAAPRIKRAINVMRQLENVANPAQYKWTEEQADKAIAALGHALDQFVNKIKRAKKDKAAEFSF